MKKVSFQRWFSLFCVFAHGNLTPLQISQRLFVLERQGLLCCTQDTLLHVITEAFLETTLQKLIIYDKASNFLPLPHFFRISHKASPQRITKTYFWKSFCNNMLTYMDYWKNVQVFFQDVCCYQIFLWREQAFCVFFKQIIKLCKNYGS